MFSGKHKILICIDGLKRIIYSVNNIVKMEVVYAVYYKKFDW